MTIKCCLYFRSEGCWLQHYRDLGGIGQGFRRVLDIGFAFG